MHTLNGLLQSSRGYAFRATQITFMRLSNFACLAFDYHLRELQAFEVDASNGTPHGGYAQHRLCMEPMPERQSLPRVL